jgi:hypothetical protein
MTHAEFAHRVLDEWGMAPEKIRKHTYDQWYFFTTEIDGKTKTVGEYMLQRKGDVYQPAFTLHKKDGTREIFEK